MPADAVDLEARRITTPMRTGVRRRCHYPRNHCDEPTPALYVLIRYRSYGVKSGWAHGGSVTRGSANREPVAPCKRNTPACIGQPAPCIGQPATCMRQPPRCIGQPGACIGDLAQCIEHSAQCIAQRSQCMRQPSQCIGQRSTCMLETARSRLPACGGVLIGGGCGPAYRPLTEAAAADRRCGPTRPSRRAAGSRTPGQARAAIATVEAAASARSPAWSRRAGAWRGV
jgi:hypothetical protein